MWAARSFYEYRHEQLQQLGSSFHLAQLEPFLNLFTQGRPSVQHHGLDSIIVGSIPASWVRSQHHEFDPNTLGLVPASLGSIPGSLGSIPASLGSIPASWVRSQHHGFDPNILGSISASWVRFQHLDSIPASLDRSQYHGFDPSIFDSIPASLGSIPASFGFDPIIL